MPGTMQSIGIPTANWQLVLTGSGMVGIINSIIAGVFAGLLCGYVVSLPIYACIGLGFVVFAVSAIGHYRYQVSKFAEVDKKLPILFPGRSIEN